MKLLNKYVKVRDDLLKYFDYDRDTIYNIENYSNYKWYFEEETNKLSYLINNEEIIDEVILEKFEGEEYIMFLVKDNDTDRSLIIFNNENRYFKPLSDV